MNPRFVQAIGSFLQIKHSNTINRSKPAFKPVESITKNTDLTKFTCAVCGTPTLTCCSICKSVFYCSGNHQKLHWSSHKADCKAPEEPPQNGQTQSTSPKQGTRATLPEIRSPLLKEHPKSSMRKKSEEIQFASESALITGTSIQEHESEDGESLIDRQNGYVNGLNNSERARATSPSPESPHEANSVNSKRFFPQQNEKSIQREPSPLYTNSNLKRKKSNESRMENQQIIHETSELNIDDMADAFMEERRKLLREIFRFIGQTQFSPAIMKCKKLVNLAERIYQRSEDQEPYLVCSDYLLYAKCLIQADRTREARNVLLDLKRFVAEHVPDTKIDYRKGKDHDKTSIGIMNLKKEYVNFLTDDGITFNKKKILLEQVKQRTNIYSTLGSMFYNIGDWNSCEELYVKYVKIVENNFGEDSYEAGDSYFQVGVLYLQHKYYLKAMACFKRAFAIRVKRLNNESHEIVADCYYNIGLVYKQTGKPLKAIYALNQSLEIRATVIGESSLPVAQCLEILGKVYFEKGDYKSSFMRLKTCYNLRKGQLTEKGAELERSLALLKSLRAKLREELALSQNPKKAKEAFEQLLEKLAETVPSEGVSNVVSKKEASRSPHPESLYIPSISKVPNTGGHTTFIRDSQNSSILQSFRENTPPSERHNSLENYSNAGFGERVLTFADTNSPRRDDGATTVVGERRESNIFSRMLGSMGVIKTKSDVNSQDNYNSDSIRLGRSEARAPTRSPAALTTNIQLRMDNSLVMGLSTDQLMQMTQLQSKLRTSTSSTEAKKLIKTSGFYQGLTIKDKLVFRTANSELFDPVPDSVLGIFTQFIEDVTTRDPSKDFVKPVRVIKVDRDSEIESDARRTESEPVEEDRSFDEGYFVRGSRSNAIKPRGSKLKGTLEEAVPVLHDAAPLSIFHTGTQSSETSKAGGGSVDARMDSRRDSRGDARMDSRGEDMDGLMPSEIVLQRARSNGNSHTKDLRNSLAVTAASYTAPSHNISIDHKTRDSTPELRPSVTGRLKLQKHVQSLRAVNAFRAGLSKSKAAGAEIASDKSA